MTTITIDNPKIEEAYSSQEIKMEFMQFLEQELWEEKVELFEVSVDDLSECSQERLKNIDSLNFVDA